MTPPFLIFADHPLLLNKNQSTWEAQIFSGDNRFFAFSLQVCKSPHKIAACLLSPQARPYLCLPHYIIFLYEGSTGNNFPRKCQKLLPVLALKFGDISALQYCTGTFQAPTSMIFNRPEQTAEIQVFLRINPICYRKMHFPAEA